MDRNGVCVWIKIKVICRLHIIHVKYTLIYACIVRCTKLKNTGLLPETFTDHSNYLAYLLPPTHTHACACVTSDSQPEGIVDMCRGKSLATLVYVPLSQMRVLVYVPLSQMRVLYSITLAVFPVTYKLPPWMDLHANPLPNRTCRAVVEPCAHLYYI